VSKSYFLFEARIDFRTESACHQLSTETNADGRLSCLQARPYQLELGLQERIAVLLVDSNRPAQNDEQIGSRRRNHIQVVKTDIDIARMYVTQLGGDLNLFETLVREFERAVDALLLIRGHRELLDDTPVLQSAIALRNPYVDPLSLLQVSLLGRKRRSENLDQKARGKIDDALATTLSGVAQGLRNTG